MNEQLKPVSTPLLATQNQRFFNNLLDVIFSDILGFVLGSIVSLMGYEKFIGDMNPILLGSIVTLIYYIPQEAIYGRTLGKLITKTKAVNEDGSKMTFWQVVGRSLCRFIPFDPLSFFGGNGRPRGWHDKLSKTMVITLKKTIKYCSNCGASVSFTDKLCPKCDSAIS